MVVLEKDRNRNMLRVCFSIFSFRFLAGTASLILLLGCGNTASPPEVIVYTSVDQPLSEPVFRDFEKRRGIEVKAVYDVEASKTTGLVNRLLAEADHPQADVFWSSEVIQTLGLAKAGVLAGYHSPESEGIAESLQDPRNRWTGLGIRGRVILINRDLVGEEALPHSLSDLFDGRFEGREVGMALPLFGTTLTHAAVLYESLGRYRAVQLFRKIKASGVRIFDGNARVAALVADGSLKAGLSDTDDALRWIGKGAPLKMILPETIEEGGLFIPGTVSLVAGARHPSEARLLIDDLLSEATEAQFIAEKYFYCPIRRPHRAQPPSWQDISSELPLLREEMRRIFLN